MGRLIKFKARYTKRLSLNGTLTPKEIDNFDEYIEESCIDRTETSIQDVTITSAVDKVLEDMRKSFGLKRR